MSVFQHVTTVIFMLNIGLAITVIFLERRNIGVTWAWLMVLLFFPVAGFILYLFLGQNLSKVKLYRLSKDHQLLLSGLVEAQRREFRDRQITFHDPAAAQYVALIHMNLSSASAFYTQNNDVEIFTDGQSKFASLLAEIERAEQHIHLMYFIVRNDGLGRRLISALAAKARQGVEVRLLHDDVGSRLPRRFFEELRRAGGRTAAFFPSKIPYVNIRVNYRNHRKLAIIDGKIGYIGGFNVGDEYLGATKRFGPWRDTHLALRGHAVLQMQVQFMLDWNLASAQPIDELGPYLPLHQHEGKVGVQIVSSGPDHPEEHLRNAYIKMIHSAKESIYIQTPYFIPDESLLTALRLAAMSGVDVRLMLPGKPDKRMVYWASLSYLGDLLPQGVRCFLYGKGFLHAKTIVVDGKLASVGTANIDIRSFKLNFEVNAVLYDSSIAAQLQRIFEQDMADSRELTREQYDNRPRLHKIRESCVRLLSPIL